MPYKNLSDGLYLLMQKSLDKGVEHYGILDVGNRIRHPQVDGRHPVVIHQTPPSIRINWLQDTGGWKIHGRIINEAAAIHRMNTAFLKPDYSLFGNNCEHFAHYVATGAHESIQLQGAGWVVGLAALTFVAIREAGRESE